MHPNDSGFCPTFLSGCVARFFSCLPLQKARRWRVREGFVANLLWQHVHSYGFCLWVRRCLIRKSLRANRLLHSVHSNDVFVECIRKCSVRSWWCLKVLPHSLHTRDICPFIDNCLSDSVETNTSCLSWMSRGEFRSCSCFKVLQHAVGRSLVLEILGSVAIGGG